MKRPKVQQGVIVDGPNRHPITPDGADQRGVQSAVVDPRKPTKYVPEREVKQEEETDDEVPDSVL